MAKKTKFFRVAVEGLTADGREISRAEIQQMADTYNPEKYGARVFVEHIRGLAPDGPFRALGDVVALKAEQITDGELKGKLALYAQIDPTDAMVKLVNSGQKIYSSVEIAPTLADSKKAYMVGLGVTDSPASLGTEILKFAAQHPDAAPFKARKQKPENVFSAAIESAIELEPEAPAADLAAGFFTKLNELLEKFAGKTKPESKPDPAAASETANVANAELLTGVSAALREFVTVTSGALDAIRADMAAQKQTTETTLAEFRTALDTTAAPHTQRPATTGGNGAAVTDC